MRCGMCTTANPPGGARCFRCDADLGVTASLLPPRGARTSSRAARPSRVARFFLGEPGLSPGDQFRLRASRILVVVSFLFLLPLVSRFYGYGIVVPSNAGFAGLEGGDRLWISYDVSGLAIGDRVTLGGFVTTQFGEVVGLDPSLHRVEISSGGRVFSMPEWRIQGRAVFLYAPVSRIRRFSHAADTRSPT